jgi:porin
MAAFTEGVIRPYWKQHRESSNPLKYRDKIGCLMFICGRSPLYFLFAKRRLFMSFRSILQTLTIFTVCAANDMGAQAQSTANASVPQASAIPDQTSQSQDFWQQSNLAGDWGGERSALNKKGIDFLLEYDNDVFGNPYGGNFGRGVVDEGLVTAGLNIDLEKLTDFWKGATFHVNGFYVHGESGTKKYVGDFTIFSNIDAYNTVRLDELWVQQNFLDDKISLKFGQLTADSEFFSTQYGALFISSTFGAFPFIGANFQPYSAPIYPLATTGFRLKVKPTEDTYLQAAAYYGDTGTQQDNNHGTRFDFHGATGLLTFYEAGYLLNQEKDAKGLPGTYKLGSYVHTADFTTWQSQAAFANGTGALQGVGANYGIYGVVDQMIWQGQGADKSNAQSLGLFLRAGWAPGNATEIDFDIDGGLNFKGLIPGRAQDTFGLGAGRTAISGDFSRASVAQGGPAYRDEALVESTYSLNLTPWLQIQPDIQYIFSAGATTKSPDALVLGLQTSITF